MKKILIALDYNPTAEKVANVGYELGKSMDAEVILLHVITDAIYYSQTDYSPIMGYSGYFDLEPVKFDTNEELKKVAQRFLDNFKHHLGNDSLQTVVEEGDFADAILTVAKDYKVDIIAIGSHSHRWLEAILMGSVAEKVLHHSPIPIFIIPTGQKKQRK
jgi:nucleotide-binding universal stress UspA family protein